MSLDESADGKCIARIPGRLSVCGQVNGNGRRYSKVVWENNLKEDSTLMQLIARNGAFGTLEHPADGKVDLLSPISHAVTKAYLKENEVWGEIQLLNTPHGKFLMALIEAGYNPLVSSRGYGSLVKSTDGVDEVQSDYICEGWDVVAKPSFVQAEMIPNREAMAKEKSATTESAQPKAAAAPAPALTEDAKPPVAKDFQPTAGQPVKPALESAGTSSPEQIKKTDNIMDIKQIREGLESLKRSDASKLTPARFADSLSRLSALHQDVAAYQAEDAKRSWEATQLHEEIKAVETAFAEAAIAPAKSLKRIEENNLKLMQVVKAVAEAGVTYKQKLATTLKESIKSKGLNEELIRRGRGWKARCDEAEETLAQLQKKFKTCTEALDLMATRYKNDVTTVGKRVIELEFKDKISDPTVAEALKMAKVPKDLIALREKLEPKPAAAAKPEEKKTDAPTTKPAAVTEAKKEEKPSTMIIESAVSPRNINEALALSLRLAKASA